MYLFIRIAREFISYFYENIDCKDFDITNGGLSLRESGLKIFIQPDLVECSLAKFWLKDKIGTLSYADKLMYSTEGNDGTRYAYCLPTICFILFKALGEYSNLVTVVKLYYLNLS